MSANTSGRSTYTHGKSFWIREGSPARGNFRVGGEGRPTSPAKDIIDSCPSRQVKAPPEAGGGNRNIEVGAANGFFSSPFELASRAR